MGSRLEIVKYGRRVIEPAVSCEFRNVCLVSSDALL